MNNEGTKSFLVSDMADEDMASNTLITYSYLSYMYKFDPQSF